MAQVAASSEVMLRPGSTGPDVEELQRKLASFGFHIGDEAGMFGEDTTFAVRAFQRMYGLVDDGLVGEATRLGLDAAAHDWAGTQPQLAVIVRSGSKQVGMATFVGEGIAVTTAAVAGVLNVRLVSPFWANEVSVDLARPLGNGLAELRMRETPDDHSVGRPNPPRKALLTGAEDSWKALLYSEEAGRITFASGRVVAVVALFREADPQLLQLSSPSSPIFQPSDAPFRLGELSANLAGAPVFVDGQLAAIWDGAGRGIWYVSPYAADAPKPTPTRTPHLRDEIFAQLGPGALRAIALAEGLRVAMDEKAVHLRHLLVGLSATQVAVTVDLVTRAGLDPASFRTLVSTETEKELPDPRSTGAPALSALPDLSDNAWTAVREASRVARAQGADQIGVRHLWYGALSVDKSPVVQALIDRGLTRDAVLIGVAAPDTETAARTGRRYEIPGVASDRAEGNDLLGVDRDVEVLCSVIAARDVAPPVSIGLFGDWGTGKTFFMKRMERWIDDMKKQVRASPGAPSAYCENVVQLWFNAWHYIDANLWASLTSEIFEGLGRQLQPGGELAASTDDPERARAHLLAAAASAKDVVAEAERKKADAEADADAIRRSLESLRASDQAIGKNLLNAAVDVAARQPEIKKKIDEAARKLGFDEVKVDTQTLRSQVLSLRRVGGFFRALKMAMTWRRVLAAGVVATALALILYFDVWHLAAAWTTKAVAVVAAFLVPFSPLLARAVRARKIIADIWKQYGTSLTNEEAARKADLEKSQADVRGRMEATQRRLDEAQRTVADLERRLDDLRSDAQMSKFVAERRESTDYTRHLGVVASARRDFERLSKLLGKPAPPAGSGDAHQPPQPHLPQIDRIILYIDDLDRCPEDKVVDVLQAVHLLLAFPLFVVVVGVDSRWLLHSLRQRAAVFRDGEPGELRSPDEERARWQSTPLNYLEKIFQIPFSLRPMPRDGFDRLIENLAPAAPQPRTAPSAAPADGSRPSIQPREPTAAAAAAVPTGSPAPALPVLPNTISSSPSDSANAPSPPPPSVLDGGPADSAAARDAVAPLDLNPAYLRITAEEQSFMKGVFELIPSPRAAKRFVNVYRLLRASVAEDEWAAFLGEDGGGECRAALLLLSIVTGYPAEATAILYDLGEAPGVPWWEFVARYRKPSDSEPMPEPDRMRWRALLDGLERVERRHALGDLGDCTAFTHWAPRVARYSFESGRLAFAPLRPPT